MLPEQAGNLTEYKVVIKTGDYKWAGTDSTVNLTIVGDKSVTKMTPLDVKWVDDHERGQKCRFSFKDINVGNIEYITLFLDKTAGMTDYWYVDYVKIKWLEQNIEISVNFPIYSWITEDHEKVIYISSNKTTLPQRDTKVRQIQRIHQTKKDTVQWCHMLEGFFGFISTKPKFRYESLDWNLKYHDSKEHNLLRRFEASIRSGKLQHFLSYFKSFDHFEFYKDASGNLGNPDYRWMENDLWQTDVEFGRQILNGPNPFTIRRCHKLPANFPLKESTIKNILAPGTTLSHEIDAGNVFIVNHNILHNIPTGRYNKNPINLPSPICLLYIKTNESKTKELIPIAIQLGQKPGSKFPIWTPNDYPLDWLLAKMWFKNADMQIQYIQSNIVRTQLFLEPVAIAFYRCLPSVHPLHKLLREHLQFVIATNAIARETLIRKVYKLKVIYHMNNFSKPCELCNIKCIFSVCFISTTFNSNYFVHS